MVKAYIINGKGIGCHEETKHAFEQAGAETEVVHINQLLSGDKKLDNIQILNFPGGFLHGDMLGAGMAAANELEHSGIKDKLIDFADKGNVIYGQCNGFQLLVRTGLLPGINGDYSEQTVTLAHNDLGNYNVDFVKHSVEIDHFAFEGMEIIDLWCRHGEGKLQFHSKYSSIPLEKAKTVETAVKKNHVLLRYVDSDGQITEKYPDNPNGSVDGIAGLVNENGNIIGHMAHTEVGIYSSRNPNYFNRKDTVRRNDLSVKTYHENNGHDVGLQIFKNIVNHFK